MRQPKRLKILNVDNGVTLDELETLKQRLFHLRINEDGPVAMKLRLLDSNGFDDINFCILLHLIQKPILTLNYKTSTTFCFLFKI